MTGDFLAAHRGGDGQEAEAWEAPDVALHMVGIANLDAHELVAAADAQYGSTIAMSLDDGLGTAVTAQFIEIVERRFCARQDDDVRLVDIVHVVRIEEMDAWILFEGIEVGIVGEVLQHDDRHIHLALLHLERLLSQRHRVFFLDMYIFIIRYDTQDRHATEIFQHLASLLKETHIPTELIDDDALDKFSVFWRLQGDAAIDGCKHPPTVDIAHQDDISLSVTGHRHIHQVAVFQIDFCDAACALHHDGVIA